ncbi:SPFH domain-containing protein [Rubrimonas cliftonensis]|uniref:SPFH domain, Band 7 family protein n=1 Tax=Rubrimonas cliftonensis TaxID=89524 RepID=A0A1H4CK05_9RHOB|nr:SPFH domain-containing protein [Rubrimonas cliftonensis]SEA60755.1 SPFH domain, Band 7 family protein [Rubrimonas cliftonensis]
MQPAFALDPASIALAVGVILLILLVLAGVRIVPQSEEYVVTRLGAYRKTLGAGVNLIIPVIDKVHARVSIADQVLNDIRLDVVSKDNVVFSIELLVVYRVKVPELATFRVNDIRDLVVGLVKSLVRAEIGKVELDMVQQDRESLNLAIRAALAAAGDDYGIVISRAEITDVQLTDSIQRAMAEVLEAERARRATITRAEGERRAVELSADAALYERQREAEAVRVTADATAYANGVIGRAIAEHGAEPASFQIAERQIAAVLALASSPNAKLVMIPGDVADGFTRAAALLADGGLPAGPRPTPPPPGRGASMAPSPQSSFATPPAAGSSSGGASSSGGLGAASGPWSGGGA